MPKQYSPKEAIRVLEYLGWQGRPGKGDHVNYNKPGNPNVITIDMGRAEIPRRIFADMLRKLGMNRRDFDQIARKVL